MAYSRSIPLCSVVSWRINFEIVLFEQESRFYPYGTIEAERFDPPQLITIARIDVQVHE